MDCVFEAYKREPDSSKLRLIHTFREHCHMDLIQRRAVSVLWSMPLHDLQDLVVVRLAESGQEIFRRAIGTPRRVGP